MGDPKGAGGGAGDVLQVCEQLESDLAGLRANYEQFFLGLERHPPVERHRQVRKRIMDLRTGQTRQTSARFRVEGVINKLLTYERLWQRTLVEIENGTYRRDVFKAKLHAKKR